MVVDLVNLARGNTFFPFSQLPYQECLHPVSVTPQCYFSEDVQKALKKCSGTDAQKKRLGSGFEPFSCMFIERSGITNVLMRRINTLDTKAKRFNPRPLSVHKKALLDASLQEMIIFHCKLHGLGKICLFLNNSGRKPFTI